jgi:hypothetical protein
LKVPTCLKDGYRLSQKSLPSSLTLINLNLIITHGLAEVSKKHGLIHRNFLSKGLNGEVIVWNPLI